MSVLNGECVWCNEKRKLLWCVKCCGWFCPKCLEFHSHKEYRKMRRQMDKETWGNPEFMRELLGDLDELLGRKSSEDLI